MSSIQAILKMAGARQPTPRTVTPVTCEKQLVIMVGLPGSGKTTKTIQEINKKNKGLGLVPQPNPFYPEEDIESSTQETSTTDSVDAACAAGTESIAVGSSSTPKLRAIACSADNYPGLYSPEGQITDLGLLPAAHDWCQRSVQECMEKGYEIYLDNTNVRPELWISYLEMAQHHGYKVNIVIPTNKLLYYEASGRNTFETQFTYLKTIRCSGTKRIPEHSMTIMNTQCSGAISFVAMNKGTCGTDPTMWITACSRYTPPNTRYSRR